MIPIETASKELFSEVISRHYHLIKWMHPEKLTLTEYSFEEITTSKIYEKEMQQAIQHSIITMRVVHPFSLNDMGKNLIWERTLQLLKKYSK